MRGRLGRCRTRRKVTGRVMNFCLKHRLLLEFECDKVEDGEGSEASMKGFAIKASISEMVSLGEGGKKVVGVKIFSVEDCREEVLVIQDDVGSV